MLKLPSSLPRGARKGSPKRLPACQVLPALLELKRFTGRDSMRAPGGRSSLARFFEKMGFSLETVRLFFRLRHLSSESAIFHDFHKNEKKNHFESRFAVLLKISVFALGVSQKSEFTLSLGF